MHKKTKKKLTLAKETVRNLEMQLIGVAGGLSANTDCTYTNCCSGYDTCGTCACGPTQTGGTKYC